MSFRVIGCRVPIVKRSFSHQKESKEKNEAPIRRFSFKFTFIVVLVLTCLH